MLVLRSVRASLYQQLKPAFVGLIVGEAAATGFWLVVAIVMAWTGNDYQAIYFYLNSDAWMTSGPEYALAASRNATCRSTVSPPRSRKRRNTSSTRAEDLDVH